MPSIRVGFSSDLNITGGNTGIGTANPTARLEVSGALLLNVLQVVVEYQRLKSIKDLIKL